MGDIMRNGNFSKKYSSNLDDITLPSWLVLSETSAVTVAKNTDSIGGLSFKRTNDTGSKTLTVPTVPDTSLSAISIALALNGLSSGTTGTLDIGFYASESDYAFLRFTPAGTCILRYCKSGVATVVDPVYLQNTTWSRFRHFKITYNFKEKTFEVQKNNGATYLSLDNIDINKAAMVPMVRWNDSVVATTDKLFSIEVEKFYL
ncbi:hypothetical protein [uncultured Acinetobacter sp.]|uniref:hypothetical protein n=1 Tax=uncultured Acinetobacter sp. TaxID=165433 RepID=UPI002585C366|nr:hypothetical protein [uncultured Acinetobacter sp.]